MSDSTVIRKKGDINKFDIGVTIYGLWTVTFILGRCTFRGVIRGHKFVQWIGWPVFNGWFHSLYIQSEYLSFTVSIVSLIRMQVLQIEFTFDERRHHDQISPLSTEWIQWWNKCALFSYRSNCDTSDCGKTTVVGSPLILCTLDDKILSFIKWISVKTLNTR